MKKLVCVLVVLIVMLSGCSAISSTSKNNGKDETSVNKISIDEIISRDVYLPDANDLQTKSYNLKNTNLKGFNISEFLAGKYLGYISEYKNGEGIVDIECLVDENLKNKTEVSYPADFPDWSVAAGSSIILKNRFIYEWKSYTSEFSESTAHDVKLTRIDGETGEVLVIDEIEQNNPFIYLCKINDSSFLSYSISKGPSERTDYATVTVATLYNTEGEKKEIINETYENDASWTDSEGILIERFAAKDGKLYGLGRRRISGEYRFFLYCYDLNGKLIDTKPLENFEKVIDYEQLVEFNLVGDYIVFRTYESLSTYICKIEDSEIEVVMKGADGAIHYTVFDNYIFFIESNVDVYTADVTNKLCPLYVIDVANERINKINFSVSLGSPYFVGLKSLSNGDIVFTYCENGEYDPLNEVQYILEFEEINKLMNQ